MDSVAIKPCFNSLCFNSGTNPRYPTHLYFFEFTHFNKLKTASVITFSFKNPSNSRKHEPKFYWSDNNRQNFPLNPLSVLIPTLQSIKGLASSQTKKWVSHLQAHDNQLQSILDPNSNSYLQTGAFGVGLLSVTLAANPTFVSGLFAWIVAQSIKVVLNFFVERKLDFRILFDSGGMPSSHLALCTALSTSVALCHGVADSLFPVCLGLQLVLEGMLDASRCHPISQRKLKELLGHTPSQVFAGAVLGILVACICCQGCLGAT